MALQLTYSNRLERVADAMAAAIEAQPLADPLQPEVVLVPHSGVGRWLQMRFAEAWGVAANLRFSLIGDLIAGTLARRGEAGAAAWTEDALALRVLAQMQAAAAVGPDGRREQGAGRESFALARAIAGRLDGYQLQRPDWIAAWNAGASDQPPHAHTRWQAALWRQLRAGADVTDRATQLTALLQSMQDGALDAGLLPARLWAVLPSTTSPWHLQFLALAARSIPVRLFRLVPSAQYWGDQLSWRELARRRREGASPDQEPDTAAGQLLASLARPTRAAIEHDLALLHDAAGEIGEDFAPVTGSGRLRAVQSALLQLDDTLVAATPPSPPAALAGELRVHACHDRRREVEVAHDVLLALFEQLPGLEPSDIAIMAPRIEDYADLVAAVFGSTPRARRIPVGQGERVAARLDALAARFDWLLDIAHARCSAEEILALLKLPAVQRRFGIDADALPALRRWIEDAGVHWGLDATHREREGAGAAQDNTWRAALARWWMGHAHGESAFALVGEVAPYAQAPACSDSVAGLEALLEALARWRDESVRARAPREWARTLSALLAQFFEPAGAEHEGLERLQQAVDALADSAARAGLPQGQPLLELDVVRAQVAERLAEQVRGRGFLSEGATVCSLVPMRSVPFRVVCVLGLDDGVFPRRAASPGFDLMRAHPHAGDRNVRDEDRQLLLETVLSARDHLHLSFVGFDARDGSKRPPAAPLAELMDFAGLRRKDSDDDGDADAEIGTVIEHRLAPWDPEAFRREAPVPAFAREWVVPTGPVASGPEAPSVAETDVDAAELLAFIESPPRWFLRERLGVRHLRALGLDEDIAESEDHGAVRECILRLVEGLFAGVDPALLRRRLRAEGLLHSGAMGEAQWRRAWPRARALHEAVLQAGGVPLPDRREVDLRTGDWHVRGVLAFRTAGDAVLELSGSGLKPWHRIRMAALSSLAGLPGRAIGYASGKVERVDAIPVYDRNGWLQSVLPLRARMLDAPLPLWPRAGWAYADALARGKDEEEALARARAEWDGNERSRGESGGFEPATLARGIAGDALGPEFRAAARALWLPLVLACGVGA